MQPLNLLGRLAVAAAAVCVLLGDASAQTNTYFVRLRAARLQPNGLLAGGTESVFSVQGAPYTLARTFRTPDGGAKLLLLSGISGAFAVYAFDANNNAVEVQTGNFPAVGWRGAEFAYVNGYPLLYLFGNREGTVASFIVGGFGEIWNTPDFIFPNDALKGMTIFDEFTSGGVNQSFAMDPNTGEIMLGTLPGNNAYVSSQDDFGWTDIDHFEMDAVEHRIQYKGRGQPWLPASEIGRFVVRKLGPSGLAASTQLDITLSPNDPYTTVRVVPLDSTTTGVIGYRRNGMLQTYRLQSTGSTAILTTLNASTVLSADNDDIQYFEQFGSTQLVGVRFDLGLPETYKMNGAKAQVFAECVDAQLEGRTLGYQLAMSQGGEVLLDRAHGMRELDPAPIPLKRDDPMFLASVSKVITTITTLALHDDGILDVFDFIVDQIPSGDYADWVSERRPVDLMGHSTGQGSDGPNCSHNNGVDVDCSSFFSNDSPNAANECVDLDPMSPDTMGCAFDYHNSHITALRVLMQEALNLSTSAEIDAETQARWMNEVVPGGPTCALQSNNSKIFAYCKPGDVCSEYGGRHWLQDDSDFYTNGFSNSCGGGGWSASARDLVRIVEATKGGQVLSAASTADLFQAWPILNGGSGALGWEPPATVAGVNDVLSKNGSGTNSENGAGYRSLLHVGPFDAHAALNINTGEGTPSVRAVVQEAYETAFGLSDCDPLVTYTDLEDRQVGADRRDMYAVLYANEDHVVTAARIIDGHFGSLPRDGLELRSFLRNGDGSLTQSDRFDLGSQADRLESFVRLHRINDSRFVAATRTRTGDFKVVLFGIDAAGRISSKDIVLLSSGVGDATLVKTGHGMNQFAMVIMNGDGKIDVSGWLVVGDSLVRQNAGAYLSSGAVGEIDAAAGTQDGDVFVVFRTSGGKSKPSFFTVQADGTVTRHASAKSSDQYAGTNIRVAPVNVNGVQMFAMSQKTSSGNLYLSTWTYDANLDEITRVWTNLGTTPLAIAGIGAQAVGELGETIAVPIRLDDGSGVVEARLYIYVVEPDGTQRLEIDHQLGPAGEVSIASVDESAPSRHFVASVHRDGAQLMRLRQLELFPGPHAD